MGFTKPELEIKKGKIFLGDYIYLSVACLFNMLILVVWTGKELYNTHTLYYSYILYIIFETGIYIAHADLELAM